MPTRLKTRMMATAHGFHVLEHAEVKQDDDGDEDPQQQNEFALRDEIGFAGFVDELGDFAHGAMHRQVLQAHVDDHAEAESEDAEQDADQKQTMAVDGAVQEADRGKIREFQRGFAAGFSSGLSQSGSGADGEQRGQRQRRFRKPDATRRPWNAAVASQVRIMSPPNESVFRNLQTCLGTPSGERFHVEHAQCSIRGARSPEFRTRFHRKTKNRVLELGRVGVRTRADPENIKTLLRMSECKTSIYNMLGEKGQSDDAPDAPDAPEGDEVLQKIVISGKIDSPHLDLRVWLLVATAADADYKFDQYMRGRPLNLLAIKRGQVLGPISAVERAVFNGFGDVSGSVSGVSSISALVRATFRMRSWRWH